MERGENFEFHLENRSGRKIEQSMGKHSQVWFVLLNRVPWDVILDGSHLAKADKEKQEATEGICRHGVKDIMDIF